MAETKQERFARIMSEGGWRELDCAPKDQAIDCLCLDTHGGADPGHYFSQPGRWSGTHWGSRSGSLVVAWRPAEADAK
jgi:hypothetical protein